MLLEWLLSVECPAFLVLFERHFFMPSSWSTIRVSREPRAFATHSWFSEQVSLKDERRPRGKIGVGCVKRLVASLRMTLY
jgi:hypothetical protein